MQLSGYTNHSEEGLNAAILNVSRKLKMPRNEFWAFLEKESNNPSLRNMNDMLISERIDVLISLCNRLYKR